MTQSHNYSNRIIRCDACAIGAAIAALCKSTWAATFNFDLSGRSPKRFPHVHIRSDLCVYWRKNKQQTSKAQISLVAAGLFTSERAKKRKAADVAHLKPYEPRANDELRSRWDKTGSLGRVLAGVEDAGYSVGLGEQRGVHHREGEAGAESGKWIKLALRIPCAAKVNLDPKPHDVHLVVWDLFAN